MDGLPANWLALYHSIGAKEKWDARFDIRWVFD